MPLRRRYNRTARLAYDLSPTTRPGLRLGRPRPCLLTPPPSISSSKATVSWRSPEVSTYVIGLPLPSHRTCTLVEYPPRLRPRASRSGPPFLPLLRAGEHVSRSYLRSGLPTLPLLWCQRPFAPQPIACPRCLVPANGRNVRRLFSMTHSVPVCLARERRSCLSTGYH